MFGETWVEHQKLKKTTHLLVAAECLCALLDLLLESPLAAAEKQVHRFRRQGNTRSPMNRVEHLSLYQTLLGRPSG